MKQREITATGIINEKGDIAMYMGNLYEFFKKHKGCRVFVKFSVSERGTSAALRGYYFACVVPTMKSALWEAGERLTEEQTEKRLREWSPIMQDQTVNEDTGKYTTRVRGISELSNAELIEHIEFLKQLAAEEFNAYIEDPKTM